LNTKNIWLNRNKTAQQQQQQYRWNSSHHCNEDILTDDVPCQLLYQLQGYVIRIRVQRPDEMMLVRSDRRTPAAVADHVTSLVDSDQCPPTSYIHPARHELTAPARARANEAQVVVAHQLLKLCVADLRESKHRDMSTLYNDRPKPCRPSNYTLVSKNRVKSFPSGQR